MGVRIAGIDGGGLFQDFDGFEPSGKVERSFCADIGIVRIERLTDRILVAVAAAPKKKFAAARAIYETLSAASPESIKVRSEFETVEKRLAESD